MIDVRKAIQADAEQFVEVMRDAENSSFMLFGPGERNMTVEQAAKLIETINKKTKSALLVALDGQQLLGYLILHGETVKRIAHRGSVVIGVHSEARRKGVGSALFTAAHRFAKEQGISRLELSVIEHNEAAVQLYKKMGYEIEGVKRNSLVIDGEYVNEYSMACLL